MAYYLRLDGTNFPVAPESWSDENNNKNELATLVTGQEINIIREDGLHNYTMDIRLPDDEYSWAYWEQPSGAQLGSGYNDPQSFIDILQALKKEKKAFELMICRDDEGDNFTQTVTLETINVTEDKEFTKAECTFKEYVDYTTEIKGDNKKSTSKTTLKPKKSSYTVASGDTLKKISKKMYGTQNYASKIYSWNKTAIENAAKKKGKKSSSSGKYIYKGTKLKLKKITK